MKIIASISIGVVLGVLPGVVLTVANRARWLPLSRFGLFNLLILLLIGFCFGLFQVPSRKITMFHLLMLAFCAMAVVSVFGDFFYERFRGVGFDLYANYFRVIVDGVIMLGGYAAARLIKGSYVHD
jgi:hypothetical protein